MVVLTERIPGFVQLNGTTSIYRPTNSNDAVATLQEKQQSPDLIVFCAWMSAAPKHIAKYTAGYQKLFPNTAILLIEATLADMTVTTTDLSPAAEIIRSFILAKRPLAYRSPSIMLHASSNGGANNAASLAHLLKRQDYTAPFDAMMLDCSPGKGEMNSAVRAMRLSLPKNFLVQALSAIFLYTILIGYFLYIEGLGKQDMISWIRNTLHDPVLLGVNVPRLYLYSRADLLVEADHVHKHAENSKKEGCGEVTEELFEHAPHCALLNEDAERYWAAIEKLARWQGKPFAQSDWA